MCILHGEEYQPLLRRGAAAVWKPLPCSATLAGLDGWMGEILDDCQSLAEISLPGTHNSACFAPTSFVRASRCQGLGLHAQLRMGVRFLDLRVRADGALCHGIVDCGLSLQDALSICAAFLRVHPREALVARVKDESGRGGVAELVRSFLESGDYPFYVEPRVPLLGEVRGRIVLLCDWSGEALGIRWGGEQMQIQDQYWHKSGRDKWRVARRDLGRAAPAPDLLQAHFTSATALPRRSPLEIARSVNPQLAGYLRSMPCPRFVGIVAMDFPTAALCELVVHRNRRILDPCRPVCGHYNGAIDNLQCELAAAATRADAAVLVHPEQLPERVAWLGQTFARLLVERARAESQQPVVEEALAAAEGSLAGELRIRQPDRKSVV